MNESSAATRWLTEIMNECSKLVVASNPVIMSGGWPGVICMTMMRRDGDVLVVLLVGHSLTKRRRRNNRAGPNT